MDEQTRSQANTDLADARRQIDEIDAGLLELLQQRFKASLEVRDAKAAMGEADASPVRPAREALLMRRLIDMRADPLPVTVMLRIWREIMSSSTLMQADTSVHCSAATMSDHRLRDLLRDHFGQLPLVEYEADEDVLSVVRKAPATIAAIAPNGTWPAGCGNQDSRELAVVATLPFIGGEGAPDLILIAQPFDEATGEDETLLCSSGRLPRDFAPAPLWELELAGGDWLTSLPGFLSGSQSPLAGLRQGNDDLALRVLGRYPSPIKINT